ncbi:N-acetylglucosamine-6-phosphate deacetylase [Oscillatoria sp. FACHB-1407]|uniref:N-acetylglucosamine-6-phosphate deacetylase n=1 Tax=Oscillatoria sp. FACHB-1407 TaxID=2692847 RepID=UPI001682582E|nr:N-acetylglucosamine-6-phosphate deacetylase [Oscillatoria sp. FACHB-1407]MBD2461842.1 N-acetylglucosamine-6-phosphate deacetylase [Oscillatoria sp. FACHB-1407]
MSEATPVAMRRLAPFGAIANARLPGYEGLQQIDLNGQRHIDRILPMTQSQVEPSPSVGQVLDVEGDWVSLGGVDVQINGALGLAFPDLSPENADKLPQICNFLWDQGVDGFLPTLVTTSVDNIQRSLSTLANLPSSTSAQIIGVHLEGPFLNPTKRGAHPEAHLLPLTIEQVKRVLGDYASLVKVMTLAPELDPTGTVIPYLRSLGITVSLGHSQATATQAQAAFEQGATMVTHAFNAMPGLHHREPGLLAAAIAHPDVSCGFIADGQHVVPLMLDLMLRMGRGTIPPASATQSFFLVSDALAPLGLPDGIYPWDEREIQVTKGTARLLDGTLSGTTLPLLTGVQNLVNWDICDPTEAIALATEAPRRAIGLPGLEPGQVANFLRWGFDKATGELTWQRVNGGRQWSMVSGQWSMVSGQWSVVNG